MSDFARHDEAQDEAADDDPRAEIARLETRLDALADEMARCRKLILAGRVAMAAGALWLAGALIGFVGLDPVALMAAIAAVIGGIVIYGSNHTTAQELVAAVQDAEAERKELISGLELRVVGGRE